MPYYNIVRETMKHPVMPDAQIFICINICVFYFILSPLTHWGM